MGRPDRRATAHPRAGRRAGVEPEPPCGAAARARRRRRRHEAPARRASAGAPAVHGAGSLPLAVSTRGASCPAPAAVHLPVLQLSGVGRLARVWPRLLDDVAAVRAVRRSHPQGREDRRDARGAAGQVRPERERQDGEGHRPHRPAVRRAARGPGHRVVLTRAVIVAWLTAPLLAGILAIGPLAGPAGAEPRELFIPLLVYRTGPYAPSGIPLANGLADYYTLLNERDGGINGVRLVWEECETQYNTRRSVEW